MRLASRALAVVEGGTPVPAKHSQAVKPIASITKLMTAMVVLDSGVDLDQTIEITDADRDQLRHSRSRMRKWIEAGLKGRPAQPG